MKCALIVVGKTDARWLQQAIDDYVGRIGHYIPFQVITLPELKNARSLSTAQQRQQEGEALLKMLSPQDTVVLLDERGKERRSIDFARWLEKHQQQSRRLVFVVGGPFGFSEAVYQRANELMSLSLMTFSHQMVRLFFTEQLYRACTIIRGESYHHE